MRLTVGPLTVLALAACHAKTPTPAAAVRPGAAGPARLAGLWEQSLTRDGREPPFVGRTRVCLGPSTAADLAPLAAGLQSRICGRIASHQGPGGAELFSLRCDLGEGGVTEISGRLVRVSPTRLELLQESVTAGATMPRLNGRHELRIDARWQGPCPAGMRPGETTLVGGFKVDLSRAAAAASAILGGGG